MLREDSSSLYVENILVGEEWRAGGRERGNEGG